MLGHRLWVGNGVSKYPRQPETVYHFDAYSTVEAVDAAAALNRLRDLIAPITQKIEPGNFDPDDEDFIASFYWMPIPNFAGGKYHSCGVLLRHRDVGRPWRRAGENSVSATLEHLGARYILDASRSNSSLSSAR